MADEQFEQTLHKHIGAVDEVFKAVEQFREQRNLTPSNDLSRQDLDLLTARLNGMGKVHGQISQTSNGETLIDTKIKGTRAKVSVPDDSDRSIIEQTLDNVQNRTKASDLFTLSVLSGDAAATFSPEERDRFLKLTEDQKKLQARFSRAIDDHPAFRKKEQEIWNNLNKGGALLEKEDWRQHLGLITESNDTKTGVDILKNDTIRQASFLAFTRDMENHRKAFHNASTTFDQTAIVRKAEERIVAYSKGLPLSEKAQIRKQSLSFVKSVKAKKDALKQLFKRRLKAPTIRLDSKRGYSH